VTYEEKFYLYKFLRYNLRDSALVMYDSYYVLYFINIMCGKNREICF
jgi:hypothetical protein